MPAIVVGDINPGGVFAALYGTVALLPDHLRARVRGLVINKLRGDPALLLDGCEQLAARTGVPVVGVIPWLDVTGLDAEDSMALDRPRHRAGASAGLGAGTRWPTSSTSPSCASRRSPTSPTSIRSRIEPGVRVRFVHDRAGLGDPTSSSCRAPRPPSPTSAGCAPAGWPRRSPPGRRRCWRSAAATRCSVAPSTTAVESGAGQVDGLGRPPGRHVLRGRQGDAAAGRLGRRAPRCTATRSTTAGCACAAASRSSCSTTSTARGWTACRWAAGSAPRCTDCSRTTTSAATSSLASPRERGKEFVSAGVSFAAGRASRPSTPSPTRWPSTSTWPPSTR